MTNRPAAETDAVLAFMRERRAQVLSTAIDQVASSSLTDLPAAVHAALGNVGSYQLDAAYAALTDLSLVTSDPASSSDRIETTRAATVTALRALETEVGT